MNLQASGLFVCWPLLGAGRRVAGPETVSERAERSDEVERDGDAAVRPRRRRRRN
jgi:hypothetical protein